MDVGFTQSPYLFQSTLEEKRMNKKSVIALLFSLMVIGSLVLGACQQAAPTTAPEPETIKETVVVEQTVKETVVVEVEKQALGEGYKLATIFPGVITDADYNTLGYLASTAVQKASGRFSNHQGKNE